MFNNMHVTIESLLNMSVTVAFSQSHFWFCFCFLFSLGLGVVTFQFAGVLLRSESQPFIWSSLNSVHVDLKS
jgi:hypothetical protein